MQQNRTLQFLKNSKRGFSLVEMLVYIFILMIVVGASLQILLLLDDRILAHRADQRLIHSGQSTLEHILDSVRNADTVDQFYSTFATNPGTLVLMQGATTTQYERVGNQIEVTVNGTSEGMLTDDAVTVTELRFFSYDNSTTELVRVELTLSANAGEAVVTKTFNASATLRGSYE